MKLFQLINW